VLSIGIFFSLMVTGLASSLPHTLFGGLTAQGVPASSANVIAGLPPIGVLFAAFLGYNPMQQLLGPAVLSHVPAAHAAYLTGRQFFPSVITQPFHDGIGIAFGFAIACCVLGAVASALTGRAEHAGQPKQHEPSELVVPDMVPGDQPARQSTKK
jgi:ABC-type thiamin/hydroxymethylpyrimidine transport system permease subunit